MATLFDYFVTTNPTYERKRKRDSDNSQIALQPPTFEQDREDCSSWIEPADWTPAAKYYEVSVGKLQVGPCKVTFIVRVVNVYDSKNIYQSNDEDEGNRAGKRKKGTARGCLKIVGRDWSGVVLVFPPV